MQQGAGRILLTGATGYVGGRLLRKLEELERPVRCMVRRPKAPSGRTAEQTHELRGSGRPEMHPNSPLELVAPGRSVRGKPPLRSPS